MSADQDPAPPGYRIRPARPADAAVLRRFGAQLLDETPFFLRGPEERAADDAEMAGVIRSFEGASGAAMMNAWVVRADGSEGPPVGEGVLIPGRLQRTRRTAVVGVGVLRAHWGRGLGRALMAAVERRAQAAGLIRLELTVFEPNDRAQRLYERLGYGREGTKRRSVELPGRGLIDEILMAKLLDEG
ncbi:MAG: GNAT family N-acetyltransferase [Marivibrio sp.]|uniref:GNAT family N-acetyltransferase n=1 Tax=Marivibrio sp. TaxID=2039719 RepID=UPI0032EA9970